ncbi:MAG: hypothetical protein JXJ04_01635 [Spirochaetales bacterium]|nr:hypothetical protein [Spirochaetales bacterium]
MGNSKKGSFFRLSPFAILAHGLIILPAFLLQENLYFRLFQTILFIVLSLGIKKKSNLVFSLLSFIFIVVFNVGSPNGEVLIHLFSFPITKQAIQTGIYKATTFIGLLALSKITIMPDLTIAGPMGGMIGKIFYYFEQLKIVRKKHKSGDIFKQIDAILLEVSSFPDSSAVTEQKEKIRTSIAGIIVLALSVLFHWGLFCISFLIK